MLKYTDEQLEEIKDNLDYLATNYLAIIRLINDENEVAHNDIPKKLELGKYVIDKCIAAFLVSGLIKRRDEGSSKLYKLTEEGRRMLSLIERSCEI